MDREPQAFVIDPATLSPEACEAFIDELYALHQAIFAGVSRDAFSRYVVRSPAERTRIQVFRVDGRAVGYAAIHMFAREAYGRPCTVVRCEVGLLRAHRGRTRFGGFFARQVLGQILRAPATPIYGLSCAVSPATYRTMVRYAEEVWPRWDRPTPPELESLMTELAELFHLSPVDPAQPLVCHVGWRTRESEAEIRRWQATTHPAARFFLDQNPGYGQGHGMLMLVPVSLRSIVRSMMRLAIHGLRRAWVRPRALPQAAVPQGR